MTQGELKKRRGARGGSSSARGISICKYKKQRRAKTEQEKKIRKVREKIESVLRDKAK